MLNTFHHFSIITLLAEDSTFLCIQTGNRQGPPHFAVSYVAYIFLLSFFNGFSYPNNH